MSLQLNKRLIITTVSVLFALSASFVQSNIQPLVLPSIAHAQELLEASTTPVEPRIDPIASNCYLFVKSLIPSFPQTKDLLENSIFPVVGGAIILDYGKLKHYVYVTEVKELGVWIKETNFGCDCYAKRFLTWEYLHLHSAQYWRVV